MRYFELSREYCRDITGLGEVYETLSCRRIMWGLRKRFPKDYHVTFLSRKEATSPVVRRFLDDAHFVASGFADIPPWRSGVRPLGQKHGVSPLLRFITFLRPVLNLLVSLESIYPDAVKLRRAHVVWFLHSRRTVSEPFYRARFRRRL